jgi:hypothetical protein
VGKWRRARHRIDKLDVLQFGVRGLLLPRHAKHVSGPRRVQSDASDVIVISVMRNGMPWLAWFLEHHRKIGVRHFAIIDNGTR